MDGLDHLCDFSSGSFSTYCMRSTVKGLNSVDSRILDCYMSCEVVRYESKEGVRVKGRSNKIEKEKTKDYGQRGDRTQDLRVTPAQ
jgi:hypothetical protein